MRIRIEFLLGFWTLLYKHTFVCRHLYIYKRVNILLYCNMSVYYSRDFISREHQHIFICKYVLCVNMCYIYRHIYIYMLCTCTFIHLCEYVYICTYMNMWTYCYIATCLCIIHVTSLQHTATHCNTMQHTATHCNSCDFISREQQQKALYVYVCM